MSCKTFVIRFVVLSMICIQSKVHADADATTFMSNATFIESTSKPSSVQTTKPTEAPTSATTTSSMASSTQPPKPTSTSTPTTLATTTSPITASTQVPDCERQCPYYYRPICATNGIDHRMFVNACEMLAFNCDAEKKYRRTRNTNCKDYNEYVDEAWINSSNPFGN